LEKQELIKRIDENIANMSTDFNINIYDEPEIYGSNANLKRKSKMKHTKNKKKTKKNKNIDNFNYRMKTNN
jgi:glutaredoxin-related protein